VGNFFHVNIAAKRNRPEKPRPRLNSARHNFSPRMTSFITTMELEMERAQLAQSRHFKIRLGAKSRYGEKTGKEAPALRTMSDFVSKKVTSHSSDFGDISAPLSSI